MARIRTIKPEFPQSETVGALSRDARLLFIQLWTIVDDAGRTRAASRMLASLLYPYDDDANKLIDGWLSELVKAGAVRRYEVEGAQYLEICKWLEHQKIDRPSTSKLPSFDEASSKPREESRASDADLVPSTLDLVPSTSAAAPLEPKPERKSRKGNQTPLPDHYYIPDRVRAYAVGLGLTASELDREHERFRNHAKQNDRRCVDWEAAERNWLLGTAEKLGRSPPIAQSSEPLQGFLAKADSDELAAWDAYGMRKTGKSFPRNREGGWRFPSQWPPGYSPPAVSDERPALRLQGMN